MNQRSEYQSSEPSMSGIDWRNCRRHDGTIELSTAAIMTGVRFSQAAFAYLRCVEKIIPIGSRQAAAVAIATAMEISTRTGD